MKLTHLDKRGRATMVDVGSKPPVTREAVAEGKVFISPETVQAVEKAGLPKGNPFEVARIAGIQAAKRTAELIPLCHNIGLDFIDVDIALKEDHFYISSRARCRDVTGIEMEALTAVAVTALTLYDMCKAADKKMWLGEIRLVRKEKRDLSIG